METQKILLLRRKLDFDLKKRYHISYIPFHIITEHVFIYLDHISIMSFLYVMQSFYKTESDFTYHAFLNFMIASVYESINQYANHMFTSCRHASIRHIFAHWTPFSKKTIQPIATLTWSEFYPHTSVYVKHNILKRHAKTLVNKGVLQCRLCIHEQTTDNSFYTKNINLRFQNYRIQYSPVCVMVADPFRCIYSREHICLSKILKI